MKMEHTEYSETSTHKIRTPDSHRKEKIQHSKQDESLKSEIIFDAVCTVHHIAMCMYADTPSTNITHTNNTHTIP